MYYLCINDKQNARDYVNKYRLLTLEFRHVHHKFFVRLACNVKVKKLN